MNAYELADEWDMYCGNGLEWKGRLAKELSDMLRQQADRIAELELQFGIEEYLHKKLATTKPLSDEEIMFMCDDHRNKYGGIEPLGLARAIEERHGIK